jgi:hypothetical protein
LPGFPRINTEGFARHFGVSGNQGVAAHLWLLGGLLYVSVGELMTDGLKALQIKALSGLIS